MVNQQPPRTIYLQWNHSESLDDGIMWCEDKVYEDDIEYTLSSYSGAWDDVLKGLGGLYEKWARGGGEARETKTALADLMQAYDKWLD